MFSDIEDTNVKIHECEETNEDMNQHSRAWATRT